MHNKSKYSNKKTVVDGIMFDSKKEAGRYCELKLLEKAGEIQNLTLQPKFLLIPKQDDERAVYYTADFEYVDNKLKATVVEDTKGFKTKDYIIKRKLFKSIFKKYKFIES